MPDRKPKASYSCAPCKRFKIKCDHNVPCSSCVRNSRQDDCLLAPAKSLTRYKELIKPNASFGRISKPGSSPVKPQALLSVRKQSKSSSISSLSSLDGHITSPEDNHTFAITPLTAPLSSGDAVSSSTHSRDNSMLLETMIGDQSIKINELSQRNAYLLMQNEELMKQVGFYFQASTRLGIQDFALPQLDNDKLLNLKRMMVELLPERNVGAILKEHFFVCVSYLNEILDSSEFKRDYEKMWTHITNDRVFSIDLSFLALTFMVFSLGLRCTPRELLLSNERLLRLWGSPEALEGTCSQWFRASRQIFAFHKHSSLAKSQVFALQVSYCQLINDLDTLDELLPQAVYDAKKSQLNDPLQNKTELGRSIWWNLCSVDTLRALDSHRTPLIMSLYSHVMLPTKSDYLKYRAQISQALSTIYNLDFQSMNFASKLQAVVSIDQKITAIASEISLLTNNKVSRFQYTALYTEICIHRYRIYESFVSHDIPIASAICSHLAISAFDSYNQLKQLYIVSQDALFITLSPLLVKMALICSVFLIRHTRLNLADIDTIKSNLYTLKVDLKSMECFSPLPVISIGIQGMQYLESVKLQTVRHGSDSTTMRLNAIMNTPERVGFSTVPLSMMDESLRLVQKIENVKTDEEKVGVEEDIQRLWGMVYEDYCAYVQ